MIEIEAEAATPIAQAQAAVSAVEEKIDNLTSQEQDPQSEQKLRKKITPLLTKGEEILFICVQKKPVITVAPDAIVLTNKRFLLARNKLTGLKFEDARWRDIADVHLEEKMLGAVIICRLSNGTVLELDSLPKVKAKELYAHAQEQEERLEDERRQRDLEEKRAAAGGTTIQMPASDQGGMPAQQSGAGSEDPMATLNKLKQMLDGGLIDQAEFDTKKAEILGRL